jgi:hypothetical protein
MFREKLRYRAILSGPAASYNREYAALLATASVLVPGFDEIVR